MLLSMTGYGRVTHAFQEKIIIVEIRSLNSKFTDIRMKIPQNYRQKEPEIRKMLSDRIERGKIDFTLEFQPSQGDEEYSLNAALFKKYYRELHQLSEELRVKTGDLFPAIMRLPNVMIPDGAGLNEEEWKFVTKVLDEAIKNFQQYRQTEGRVMEQDMRGRIEKILTLLRQLDPHEQERVHKLRQRLQQNLEEYLGKENVDENRFEQEVLFYLEKIDINEEKVRLEQHCKYFLEEMEDGVTQKGRKLSFICQEMGREINTLGAKAYSSSIQRIVVNMKDELEKIKEQVANSV